MYIYGGKKVKTGPFYKLFYENGSDGYYKNVGPPLWPTNIGERRTTFAKAYGIKARCYWELFALTPPQIPPSPTSKKKGGPFTP